MSYNKNEICNDRTMFLCIEYVCVPKLLSNIIVYPKSLDLNAYSYVNSDLIGVLILSVEQTKSLITLCDQFVLLDVRLKVNGRKNDLF